ncbi:MAG: hypothetical protein GYB42_08550 [Alphaproteobacteria bacterium]|nr:hypothetical protein [Alphaproteobacteria bacterium]
MPLRRIVLRLARNPGFPEGDDKQGYVIVAPLDGEGQIDLEAWRANRQKCTVVRFHPDPDEKADGWLTHRGDQWRFRYDEDDEGPDEPGYRLAEHDFRPGEYVTIAHHGDTTESLTYIVTEVQRV